MNDVGQAHAVLDCSTLTGRRHECLLLHAPTLHLASDDCRGLTLTVWNTSLFYAYSIFHVIAFEG
jgi:hypothetical protein